MILVPVLTGNAVPARATAQLGIGEVKAGPQQAARGDPKRQQAARAARAPKQEWETVAVTEDVESKVKRVKQVSFIHHLRSLFMPSCWQ